MTDDEINRRLSRLENAENIMDDFEAQHAFPLPAPWREAVPRLLRGGLSDPDLHLIFQTLLRVEFNAGRLAARPLPPAAVD